jgi:hypothetical protein
MDSSSSSTRFSIITSQSTQQEFVVNILVTSGILNEVLAERQAQEVKHPGHVHRLPEWHLILSEEVGEVARDILELHFLRKFAGVGGPSPFKEKDMN